MMRTTTSVKKKRFFLPYKVHFFAETKDTLEYLIGKLNGKHQQLKLIPYYNNFKGRIFNYDDNTFISEGILLYDGKNIEITELPVKLWTSDYKEFLEELVESKDSLFKNYQNLSSDTEVKFILKVETDKLETVKKLLEIVDENGLNQLYKMLKLYKTIKVSNLTLYDSKGSIKTYSNVSEIINEFYEFRLEWIKTKR